MSTNINWNDIHERLAVSKAAIENEATLTETAISKILKDRAMALAREPDNQNEKNESIEVLEFSLAYENYAIELSYVQEVWPLKSYTLLPGTPSHVFGIVNIRSQVFSVFDLKKFFELPDKGISDLNKVIVLAYKDVEFGILADAILGVRDLTLTELQLSLPTLTGVRHDYLKGITREQIILLDAKKLVSDKSLIIDESEK